VTLLTAVRASTSSATITAARVKVSHCESFTRVSWDIDDFDV
jgi:hypothetical protein